MSVQGGTLGRLGTTHVPIWPVATLLAAAIAGAIALSTLGSSVGEAPAATSDAVFEQVTFPRGLENAGAYPAAVPVPIPVGLENPSAYGISQVTEAGTFPVGLENPGAYSDNAFTAKAGRHQLIEVNGRICGQCR